MKVIELKFGTVFLVSSYHIATKSKGQFPFSIVVFFFFFQSTRNPTPTHTSMSHRWTAVSLKRRSGMQDWRSRVTQTSTSRQTLWLIWRLVSLWCLLRSCSTLYYAAQGGSKGPLIIYRLGRGRGKGRRVFWGGTESFRRNGRGISHANRVLRGGRTAIENWLLITDCWLLMRGWNATSILRGLRGGWRVIFLWHNQNLLTSFLLPFSW